MSKLPIKNPSVKLIPSVTFRKFVTQHFSRDSLLPEVFLNICKNKLTKCDESHASSDEKPIQFTKEEQAFLKLTNSQNDSCERNLYDTETVQGNEPENVPNTASTQKSNANMLTLSLNDLKWLHQALNRLRKDDPDIPYLHELMVDSELVLPENEILERNPELEARCQRLRKAQEAREYEAMTRNVDNVRTHMPQDTLAFQMKQINRQLIAVAQFIFSVAAGFAFGFIGIELIIGQLDFGFRLLLGIMIALIIALAEIYFLAKKLNEEYDMSVQQPGAPNPMTFGADVERKVVDSIRVTAKTTVSSAGKLHND